MNKQTQEALKMAIEALETAEIQSEYDGLSNLIFEAIQACKEALEHPTITYEQGFDHGYNRSRYLLGGVSGYDLAGLPTLQI